MANIVETGQGREGENNELLQWIETNNLNDNKSQILKSGISLQEFGELSAQSLQSLQFVHIIFCFCMN